MFRSERELKRMEDVHFKHKENERHGFELKENENAVMKKKKKRSKGKYVLSVREERKGEALSEERRK